MADSGYGVSGPFRDGLAERGLHYIVGVTDEMVVFTEEPRWVAPDGRHRRPPAEAAPAGRGLAPAGQPEGAGGADAAAEGDLAGGDQGPDVRAGSPGCGSGRARAGRPGECAGAEPIWLLIEEQADGKLKYAFSNLPADTSRIRAVRLWRSRWPVELGYQQMKEELGLDHHEGRSWRGFHHHACLVMLAYGFLTLERRRARRGRSRPGKKGDAERR